MSTLVETQDHDASVSPLVRFGQELRRSRRAMRWSQAELGRRMGYSDAMISYIERAKKPVTSNFAIKADEVFQTGGTFLELWRRYARASLLEGFAEFADAEARCRRLRTFELGVIPGLFQTEAYATALETANIRRGSLTQEQADERVAFLMQRQRLLDQKAPPTIHAVLDQSCLLRPIGGRAVMLNQLDHLESLAAHPNITIQVAPFELAEQRPFVLPLVLLTLPDRSVVGYAESQLRGYLERGRPTIAGWEEDYDQLQVESLSTAASLTMIRAVRKDLE
ncbi:helix-turn-helix domain-containing protein [Kitasatospora purpeofusca]|uniref:helix-turn-helix domain-containing protein n=1 Tax=Kitasatospora purpeofusca TaxID=67352 RepID=UPI0036D40E95